MLFPYVYLTYVSWILNLYLNGLIELGVMRRFARHEIEEVFYDMYDPHKKKKTYMSHKHQ